MKTIDSIKRNRNRNIIKCFIEEKSVIMLALALVLVSVVSIAPLCGHKKETRQRFPIVYSIYDYLSASSDILDIFGEEPTIKYRKNSSELNIGETGIEGKSIFDVLGNGKNEAVRVDWSTVKQEIVILHDTQELKKKRIESINPNATCKVTIKKVEFLLKK